MKKLKLKHEIALKTENSFYIIKNLRDLPHFAFIVFYRLDPANETTVKDPIVKLFN